MLVCSADAELDASVRELLGQVAARCPMLAPSVARIEQLARGDDRELAS